MSAKKISGCLLVIGILLMNQGYSQTQKHSLMKAFKINVPEQQITELQQRIRHTRWFSEPPPSGWSSSLSIEQIKQITNHWLTKYNWKQQETWLNSFEQFTVEAGGFDLHFVFEKGKESRRIPLLLLHGWAGSYTQYLPLVELLREQNPELDIIVPSFPGFGYSKATDNPITTEKAADALHELMTKVLGYDHYYIHGGDFGAFTGEQLAIKYPESVKGLHLTDIPYYHLYGANENLSAAETKFMEKINTWSMMDGAYAGIQGSKPKILSIGLNDSPVALAAWLLQLHQDFSDKEKSLSEKYNMDALLTNISLYWFTGTVYSSMRIYSEDDHGFGEAVTGKAAVPTGFSFFPHDISGVPPKEFVKRFFPDIVSWSEPASGGHFAVVEDPELVRKEIVEFIRKTEKN